MTTDLMLNPGREQLDLPPPLALRLVDADRDTGWIADDVIGFRGFASDCEAAHAAWVAYGTLLRRLARTHGVRPVPIGTEPLSVQWYGDRELILARTRPFAELLRPGPESRSGPDSFGFEIRVPRPMSEVEMRALALLAYRALRRSGIAWQLWRPRRPRSNGVARDVERATPASTTSTDHLTTHTNPIDGEPGHAANHSEIVGMGDATERGHWRARLFPVLPWRRTDGRAQRAGGRVRGVPNR